MSGPGRWRGLPLALTGGVCVLLLSYVRRLGDIGTALFHDKVLDSINAGPILGTALARNLELFVAALLLLHLLLGAGCWLAACASTYAWPRLAATRAHWVLLWLCGTAFALLVANAYYYPGSSLGEPYAQPVRADVGNIDLALVVLGAFGTALALTITGAWRHAWQRHRQRTARTSLSAGLLFGAGVGLGFMPAMQTPPPQTAATPNIILVGFDSLRADAVSATTTPAIQEFMDGGVQFTDVTTPIARTFPSWIAILTGNGPARTGAVANLAPRASVRTAGSLPETLRARGYHTAYAISETRFSNIDATYGFDSMVTPPAGASDFLISWFGDAPLLNLTINSALGARLFPYLHANRGASITYDPDEFLGRVERELPHRAPLFLVVHFMLAHWPYTWDESIPDEHDDLVGMARRYAAAVPRLDAQFAKLLAMLRRRGVLDNAIVVVLSDHGESFTAPEDFLLAPDAPILQQLELSTAWGHGSSVLVPSQYHVVLGMHAFGAAAPLLPQRGRSTAPATLMDLAPTFEELLGLPDGRHDGLSLAPVLRGAADATVPFRQRVRFTETEFNPAGILDATGAISTSNVAAASTYYELNPRTDRLEIRTDRLNRMLVQRQFAAIGPTRTLAAFPCPSGAGFALLDIDTATHAATRLPAQPEPRLHPESAQLWEALQSRLEVRPVSEADCRSPIPTAG